MLRYVAFVLVLCSGCQVLYPKPNSEIAVEPTEEIQPIEDGEDHLARAADCIEAGDQAGAVPHMLKQIEKRPEQIMIRAYLAELLLRLKRDREARYHFEQFIADAQSSDGPARNHLVHCHTRLMEMAIAQKDNYQERLHRGIGLYLLAQQNQSREEADASITQELLFKSSKELDEAYQLQPETVRAVWYLYLCWRDLDQSQPAEKMLRRAYTLAPLGELTPIERRELRFASRSLELKR